MADCAHSFDVRRDVCMVCGLTGSAIAAGRDKPASWGDVDAAYERGFANGYGFGLAEVRRRRRRAFAHGARWVLRRLDHG